MVNVDVDVQHTLMCLEQLKNCQYAVVHVAEPRSLTLHGQHKGQRCTGDLLSRVESSRGYLLLCICYGTYRDRARHRHAMPCHAIGERARHCTPYSNDD